MNEKNPKRNLRILVPPSGFEPETDSLEVSNSIHLSYRGLWSKYRNVFKIIQGVKQKNPPCGGF